MHTPLKHLPPKLLHPIKAYWPFQIWGLAFIGPIHPTWSNGHNFILMTIEYLTKWAEATPLRRENSEYVV